MMLEVLNIVNELDKISWLPVCFLVLQGQGHLMSLKGSTFIRDKRKLFFKHCVINLWELLPCEISEAKSKTGFKKGFTIYMYNSYFGYASVCRPTAKYQGLGRHFPGGIFAHCGVDLHLPLKLWISSTLWDKTQGKETYCIWCGIAVSKFLNDIAYVGGIQKYKGSGNDRNRLIKRKVTFDACLLLTTWPISLNEQIMVRGKILQELILLKS